jgi:hypothetical protein
MFAGCRRLRRVWRNGKALSRHLLLQVGGTNIANPPPSSPLAEGGRLRSLLLRAAAAIAVSDGSLRSQRFALGSRLIRRRSRTEERVRSFLLTTAARETNARSSDYRHYPVSRADSSTGVTNRYPTLRTVPMTDSYSGPSLARSRRTCTSTVRVPP